MATILLTIVGQLRHQSSHIQGYTLLTRGKFSIYPNYCRRSACILNAEKWNNLSRKCRSQTAIYWECLGKGTKILLANCHGHRSSLLLSAHWVISDSTRKLHKLPFLLKNHRSKSVWFRGQATHAIPYAKWKIIVMIQLRWTKQKSRWFHPEELERKRRCWKLAPR